MVIINKLDGYISGSSCLPIRHNGLCYRKFCLYNKIMVIGKIFFDSI